MLARLNGRFSQVAMLMNLKRDDNFQAGGEEQDNVALVWRAILLAGWMGLLLWLSLASRLPSVPRVFAWDKLHHALAHAVLAWLAGRFFILLWRSERSGWWSGFLLSLLFGIFVEVAQGMLTANRHADWHDLAANIVGAGSVVLVALLLSHYRHRNRGRQR